MRIQVLTFGDIAQDPLDVGDLLDLDLAHIDLDGQLATKPGAQP